MAQAQDNGSMGIKMYHFVYVQFCSSSPFMCLFIGFLVVDYIGLLHSDSSLYPGSQKKTHKYKKLTSVDST